MAASTAAVPVAEYPRLRAEYTSVTLDGPTGDYLLLLGEGRTLQFDRRADIDTINALDGTVRAVDVVTALGSRHGPVAVAGSLRKLARLELLANGHTDVAPEVSAGWDSRGVDPGAAEDWLRTGRILLVGDGAGRTAELLRSFGPSVECVRYDDPGLGRALAEGERPVVAAPTSMIDRGLRQLNHLCLDAGRSWTIIRPHGLVLLVGPHLVPGLTGCWECLHDSWRAHEQVENFVELAEPGSARLIVAHAATLPARAAAIALLAAELPVLVQRGWSSRISGQMVALDTRDLTTSTHSLVRRPQCAACGDPTVYETGAPTAAVALAEDVDRFVSPYLGVVSRLVPLERDTSVPTQTCSASHPFVFGTDPETLRTNLRGLSGGKGRTAEQARVAAVGEAIERVCGIWSPARPVRRASVAELPSSEAVEPRRLHLFSAQQYADRERINASVPHFHRVAAPLDDDTVISWTRSRSLTTDATRWLPSAYCWYGHPETTTPAVSAADSNGCAAGTSRDDATVRGFTELVERDSAALWWFHRSRLPGVDLDSFRDEWIDDVREHYERELDRSLWVLDMSTDLDVPAYVAVSAHRSRPTEDVIFGFGCGLSAAEGVNRALAEINQFLPMVARFDGRRTRYGLTSPAALRWFTGVTVADQVWLQPDPAVPATHAGTYDDRTAGTDEDRLARCVSIAASAGLEVIVVDQSRPDIPVPVVRTVVPGLRHFWRRLGPGRLWDVPAALGRTPRSSSESTVNPYDIFF